MKKLTFQIRHVRAFLNLDEMAILFMELATINCSSMKMALDLLLRDTHREQCYRSQKVGQISFYHGRMIQHLVWKLLILTLKLPNITIAIRLRFHPTRLMTW